MSNNFKSKKQRVWFMSLLNKNRSKSIQMKHRTQIKPEDKFDLVMKEYEKGQLHSSNGEIVTDKRQALAISYSEARKIDRNYATNPNHKHHSLYKEHISIRKSSLTPYEEKEIKTSIKEEKKANSDYLIRSRHSKNTKVKKTFKHIAKEERQHAKEETDLLNEK